jgi:signal transduction histidine kinase
MIGFFVLIFMIYLVSIINTFSMIDPQKIFAATTQESAKSAANILSKSDNVSLSSSQIYQILVNDPHFKEHTQETQTLKKIIEEVRWRTLVITLLATLIGYFILRALFVLPIEKLIEKLRRTDTHDTIVFEDKSEIGMLVDSLNTRTHHLIEAQKRESEEYQLRIAQEEMLIQQSKMAMMGEMMDSVAHQWKQPLNALTLYSELIRNDFNEGNVDKAYIEKFRKDIQLQIDHMVNTLDEFRSFFRPSKERNDFKLLDVVNSALFLAKDDILKHRILVRVEQEDEIVVNGYANEFKHLILNIINNAKDAFIEHDISKRLIRIRLIASENEKRLEIEDNAGGIPEEVVETIFEANVTTKSEGKGTGIGLYMSRQIAQKHEAVLSVENREEGACFIVSFSS